MRPFGEQTCPTRVDASSLLEVVALALEKLPLGAGPIERQRRLGQFLERRGVILDETLKGMAIVIQLRPFGVRSTQIAFEPGALFGIASSVCDSSLFLRRELLFSRTRQLRPKVGRVEAQQQMAARHHRSWRDVH